MAIWTSEIKELEKLVESFKGQIPELEKEIGQLIKSDDANVLMLYSRRCLEVIITDLCERELKRPRKTDPLKGIIDKLNKEEKVPSHIITSMDHVNGLSTYGAHPKDFDPEQVKPVLSNLAIILKWYLRYKGIQIPGKDESEQEKSTTKQNEIQAEVPVKTKKKLVTLLTGLALLISAVVVLELLNVIDLGIRSSGIANLEKSIAVLPFKNDTPDTANIYFIDGLMEEVLYNLQRIGDLRVISRTSAEQYRKQSKTIPEIARELGVNYIVEGSGQRYGNSFRLNVQLLRAAKESHLWGGSYQNEILEVKDIFKIQSEIAESIASKLKAILTPREKELIEKIPTSNMEAWEAYLKGRYYWSRLSEKDMETAMKYFELAKDKDPDFALAYAGIGSVWIGWRQMGLVGTADATPKADEAVNKALEIDKDLADVQYMLAVELVWGKYDWKGGEAAFRKTLELNPNHAEAHAYYSHLLNIEGRRVEAMNHIETALKLDPLSPLIKALYGIDLMFLRRYDDAIIAYQKSLEINPTQGVAANNIVIALYFAGREDEAIERQSAGINIKSPEGLKAWNKGADSAGFRGANKKLAQFRAKRAQVTHSQTYGVALRYALAGDIDNTIYWLEKTYEERDPNLPYLLLPTWDNLRDNPRFQEIARKMNLPYK